MYIIMYLTTFIIILSKSSVSENVENLKYQIQKLFTLPGLLLLFLECVLQTYNCIYTCTHAVVSYKENKFKT